MSIYFQNEQSNLPKEKECDIIVCYKGQKISKAKYLVLVLIFDKKTERS